MSGESPVSPRRRSGMGRTPCCDKVGMRRGPWTPQEDEILINYITTYGHGNWRVLPKRAGLLRCGKSCRLRWVNYLRPDIKRGNFTAEEMETVVKLHQELGNKWSMIAARLPGRTDNEIKNVWNAHLKKKKKKKNARGSHPEDAPPETVVKCESSSDSDHQSGTKTGKYWENATSAAGEESLSEISTSSAAATEEEKEESFWSEVVAGDDLRAAAPRVYHSLVDFPYDLNVESGNDFWSDIY